MQRRASMRNWHASAEQAFGGNDEGHNLNVRWYRHWLPWSVGTIIWGLVALTESLDGKLAGAAITSLLGVINLAAAVTAYRNRN
jgi:hypothetical protein